jgi:hypothetical protein
MKGTFPRRRLGRLLAAAANNLAGPTDATRRPRYRRAALVLAIVAVGGSALIGAQVAAAATAVETVTPFTFGAMNPCTGEPFSGTGAMHFLVGGNVSLSGMTQSHTEANLEGLKAYGMLTGKRYVVGDTSNETYVFDATDLMPFHYHLEWTVHFVRQGEDGSLIWGDDYFEHIKANATVNANGVVTVDDYSNDESCK